MARPKTMGGRMQKSREEADLTKAELGRRAGVSHAMISLVENEHRLDMGAKKAFKIADILGVSCRWLVTGKGKA